jgi:hypothetical protein
LLGKGATVVALGTLFEAANLAERAFPASMKRNHVLLLFVDSFDDVDLTNGVFVHVVHPAAAEVLSVKGYEEDQEVLQRRPDTTRGTRHILDVCDHEAPAEQRLGFQPYGLASVQARSLVAFAGDMLVVDTDVNLVALRVD